jgi:hypothetical protein
MSMLTPPGMGGKYRITGTKYPRMRRSGNRRRITLAVISTLGALGLAGWGTLQLIDVFLGTTGTVRAENRAACDTTPRTKPSPSARPLPSPRQITVNVYNATKHSGLAQRTADELKKRGFKIGKVDNASPEYDKKVKSAGILLGASDAGQERLKVLGTQLTDFSTKADARKGDDVDLIIGDGFKNLLEKKDADQALTALTHPSPTPSPSRKC